MLRAVRFAALIVMLVATSAMAADSPTPLLKNGQPVDWWFVFKFNTASFPACGGNATRVCLFGGEVQTYKRGFGQQYVYASSQNETLRKGSDCAGDTVADPIGATFNEIYNGSMHYVVWNDQLYDDPPIKGCQGFCAAPWGHSKGILAWGDDGSGVVMQVSTPSWPASGSVKYPRMHDGNTLGCVHDDNVLVSAHFFSLKLSKDDVMKVLNALRNASVVTDPTNPQLVENGGPPDVASLVNQLGRRSTSTTAMKDSLTSGVVLISKPSHLNVAPWQLVSAELGGVSLRAATWWETSKIPTTTADTPITCWSDSLPKPGAVEIATSGQWDRVTFGLKGAAAANYNHAKIGVSIDGSHPYAIFGDMNQEGSIAREKGCNRHQNARGGLFFVIEDAKLHDAVANLIRGDTAPTE